MAKRLPYRLIRSSILYRGHIIRLVKDRFILKVAPHKIVTRELVVHPGAVVILPFVGPDRILLIRQFRYAAQGDLWEIPAGTLEKNESPLACARRELEEETGFKAARWRYLTRFYPAPGISNERMYFFSAHGLKKGTKQLDHDEWINSHVVTLEEARRMIEKRVIQDAKTIAGILWALTLKPKHTKR
ncbi:MAG: NUDIX hydrolase [Candidatus Omnitrophica bacterium]|nr:NUDIX hydrolase [Candidatus Omnitrophota bacterium]